MEIEFSEEAPVALRMRRLKNRYTVLVTAVKKNGTKEVRIEAILKRPNGEHAAAFERVVQEEEMEQALEEGLGVPIITKVGVEEALDLTFPEGCTAEQFTEMLKESGHFNVREARKEDA